MSWGRGAKVAMVLLVAACGCSSDSAASTVDGPLIRYPQRSSSGDGMDAEIEGVLEHEGDCLYLQHGELDDRYPVIWPAGSTWDATDPAVLSPSQVRMPVGSEVYGGGGYLYVDDVERLIGSEAAARAAQCVDNAYGEIAFVNNRDDGIRPAQ
jgi:hypothetical protein